MSAEPNKTIDRRAFLKTLAASSALFALAGCTFPIQPDYQQGETTMSTEQNKDRVRRAFDVFVHQGDLSQVGEYIAANYVGDFAGFPPVQGIDGFTQFLAMQNAAFSERRITFEDMIAEGDNVANTPAI
jgi:hypothetical protein